MYFPRKCVLLISSSQMKDKSCVQCAVCMHIPQFVTNQKIANTLVICVLEHTFQNLLQFRSSEFSDPSNSQFFSFLCPK